MHFFSKKKKGGFVLVGKVRAGEGEVRAFQR